MKLALPSFTGVLPVALRTRVCGMVTDSEVQKFETHLGPFESSSLFGCSSRGRKPAFQSNSVVIRHGIWISSAPLASAKQCRILLVFAIVRSLDLPGRSRFERTVVWRQTAYKSPVLRFAVRISEPQCCTKVVAACREEFGPAAVSKQQYWVKLLHSLGSLVHAGLSSQDTVWTLDGRHDAFSDAETFFFQTSRISLELRSAGVTRHKKSSPSAHQVPVPADVRTGFPR